MKTPSNNSPNNEEKQSVEKCAQLAAGFFKLIKSIKKISEEENTKDFT